LRCISWGVYPLDPSLAQRTASHHPRSTNARPTLSTQLWDAPARAVVRCTHLSAPIWSCSSTPQRHSGRSWCAVGEQSERFGNLLRRYREAAGCSQEELAERAGLSKNAIGILERGERRHPYPDTLRRLAAALELSDAEHERLVAAARTARGAHGPRP